MIIQGPKNFVDTFWNLLKYYFSSLRMIPQGQQGKSLYPNFTRDKTETRVQVFFPGQNSQAVFPDCLKHWRLITESVE